MNAFRKMPASNQPKTIAITGGTLWGNRGAEAMLVTTIGRLRHRFPDARFLVFSYYPESDADLCSDPDVEFYNCRPLNLALRIFPLALLTWLLSRLRIRAPQWMRGREVTALSQADVLCDIGGITFNDGREIFLLYNVLSILPAMLLGIPVVKLSQAMGPFQNPINRFWARRILSRCQMVFARGASTSDYLGTLPLSPDRRKQASDVAFAYDADYALTHESPERVLELEDSVRKAKSGAFQTVAIVPSSLVMGKSETYIPCLTDLVLDLIAAGNHVILLPNATRQSSDQGRNNDLVAIRAIVAEIEIRGLSEALSCMTAVDFDVNTLGIRHLMSLADVAVTSRFHGMVAALSLAIPVVVIGWSHKYAEVLRQFECEELCLDFDTDQFDASELSQLVFNVLANQPIHREQLQKHLPAVKQSSVSQMDYVAGFLDPNTGKRSDRKRGYQQRFRKPAFLSSTR